MILICGIEDLDMYTLKLLILSHLKSLLEVYLNLEELETVYVDHAKLASKLDLFTRNLQNVVRLEL